MRVRINGRYWDVSELNKREMNEEACADQLREDGTVIEGLCRYGERRIMIYRTMPLSRKGLTLAHEMLHAQIHERDLSYRKFKGEEEFVENLEEAVFDIVRNFPDEYK